MEPIWVLYTCTRAYILIIGKWCPHRAHINGKSPKMGLTWVLLVLILAKMVKVSTWGHMDPKGLKLSENEKVST